MMKKLKAVITKLTEPNKRVLYVMAILAFIMFTISIASPRTLPKAFHNTIRYVEYKIPTMINNIIRSDFWLSQAAIDRREKQELEAYKLRAKELAEEKRIKDLLEAKQKQLAQASKDCHLKQFKWRIDRYKGLSREARNRRSIEDRTKGITAPKCES